MEENVCQVNEFITLKLENNKTVIYQYGERYDEIKINKSSNFQDHCLNFKEWVKNGYDLNVLKYSFGLPLIIDLIEEDPIIEKAVVEGILDALLKKDPQIISYLIEETALDISDENEISLLSFGSFRLSYLPESIANLDHLKMLYLDDNDLRSLPESIGQLTTLTYLDVEWNQLLFLPDSIGNLTSLEELILKSNRLARLPDSMRNLTSLKKLDLRDNPLAHETEPLTEKIIKTLEERDVQVYL